MKKVIIILLCSLFLLNSFILSAYSSAGEYNWYCRRNGNKQPQISCEEELIGKYNGYSIDRCVSDSSAEKVIYITFDAGYENGNVSKILDTLKEEGVPAAFFVLDNIVIKNTDLVNRMANEGHLVCNHTKRHRNICRMNKAETEEELLGLERIYRDKTGKEMAKYFRFPEGRYSIDALKAVSDMGYKTVFWSFAYDDWDNTRQMNDAAAISKVISNTHNGAVMLFHPTSSTNARIFKELIRR